MTHETMPEPTQDVDENEAHGDQRNVIRVGPALGHGVTTIVRADVSLAAGVGETVDDQRVLVPFLDMSLFGLEGEEQPVWIGRLPLDNVAFLLEQVSVGLAEAMEPLASMSLGDLKALPHRLQYAADRAASASESLREAAVQLRALAARKV